MLTTLYRYSIFYRVQSLTFFCNGLITKREKYFDDLPK